MELPSNIDSIDRTATVRPDLAPIHGLALPLLPTRPSTFTVSLSK